MDAVRDGAEVVRQAGERTLRQGPAHVAVRVAHGQRHLETAWEAVGVIDPSAGVSRLRVRTGADHDAWFREIFLDGDALYERLTLDSATWRTVRETTPGSRPLTDDLFGILRLRGAVARWQRVEDGERAGRYRGVLRRRLGDANDGSVAIIFRETLPFVIHRRRLLDVSIDGKGVVCRVDLTTDGPGVRYEQKWLQLVLWDFGSATVPPMDAEYLLTGTVAAQLRQQWRHVRSREA